MDDSKIFYLAVGMNIKKYRQSKNYSLQDLADKVGLTKKTIQRYENGEIRISMDRLNEIAQALNVDISVLLEGTQDFLGLNVDDIETINIPIYGNISCGNGLLVMESPVGYESTPKSWLNGGEYFYLRAKGDSMTGARIFEGDLLLIRKQPIVEDGDIAAVVIEDECVMKRVYYRDGSLILQSENPKYPPIVISEGNVRIVGKLKKIVINM